MGYINVHDLRVREDFEDLSNTSMYKEFNSDQREVRKESNIYTNYVGGKDGWNRVLLVLNITLSLNQLSFPLFVYAICMDIFTFIVSDIQKNQLEWLCSRVFVS